MIYFDNAATTKVSDSAAQETLRVMTELYANPSSVHDFGFEAEMLLKASRKELLSQLGSCDRGDDFIFTSGGTEASNIAIFGSLAHKKHDGKKVFFSDCEHSSVYSISKKLKEDGYDVRYIPTRAGVLDLDFCEREFDSSTSLISCMMINNETGAVFDIKALSELKNRKCPNAILHCDCVQSFKKTEFPLCSCGADLISVSGHKIHAPKGVGGLYIKKGVRVSGLILGGGQEKDIRPGTEPLPLIAAFAKEAAFDRSNDLIHVKNIYDSLAEKINTELPEVIINTPVYHTPYIMSLTIPRIKSEVMLRFLSSKGIYISAGSACTSKHRENRVLKAFGLSDKDADCTIRVSFSTYNTENETEIFVTELKRGIKSLASMR